MLISMLLYKNKKKKVYYFYSKKDLIFIEKNIYLL